MAAGEVVVWGDISLQGCLYRGPFLLARSYNTDAPETNNIKKAIMILTYSIQILNMNLLFWPLWGSGNNLQTALTFYHIIRMVRVGRNVDLRLADAYIVLDIEKLYFVFETWFVLMKIWIEGLFCRCGTKEKTAVCNVVTSKSTENGRWIHKLLAC